ncbi:hypothetical protein Y032_0715g1771 [Ancylostoma ceylanicum]|nr:hypothetical protein Y032_0715g1771 [Ancylostoma ceylanicum]
MMTTTQLQQHFNNRKKKVAGLDNLEKRYRTLTGGGRDPAFEIGLNKLTEAESSLYQYVKSKVSHQGLSNADTLQLSQGRVLSSESSSEDEEEEEVAVLEEEGGQGYLSTSEDSGVVERPVDEHFVATKKTKRRKAHVSAAEAREKQIILMDLYRNKSISSTTGPA